MVYKTGVTIQAIKPILPDGVTIEQTQWVISTDKSLTDESKFVKNETNNNLYSHRFVVDIDDSKEYWSSFRFILNNGFTEFAEPMLIVPDEANDAILNIDTPSLVAPVTLNTGFDKSYHPSSMFEVTGSQFNVVGDATHVSTTWIAEDENNNVIFIRERDTENLTSLFIDHRLPDGLVKIKTIYHGSNNDSSQISQMIINVSNSDRISFLDRGIVMNEDHTITVRLKHDNGVHQIRVKHYVDGAIINDMTRNTFTFNIDADDNIIYGRHILEIRTVNIDNTVSEPRFITFEVEKLGDSIVVIIPDYYGAENKTTVNLEAYNNGNNGFDYTFPVVFS